MARILIVEDEPDLGELYRLALESAGHTVLGIYADPATPLTQQNSFPAPDLVILDERLGVRSGTSFVPEYRRTFRNARFMLVSADLDAVREAQKNGFDEAKRKPVTFRHLVENVAHLLSSPSRGDS